VLSAQRKVIACVAFIFSVYNIPEGTEDPHAGIHTHVDIWDC